MNSTITSSRKTLLSSITEIDQPRNATESKITDKTSHKSFINLTDSDYQNYKTETLKEISRIFTSYLVADEQQQKSFLREQANLESLRRNKSQTEKELDYIDTCKNRVNQIRNERRGHYSSFFDLLNEEEKVLEDLYKPLKKRLDDMGGTCTDLEFFVHRKICLDDWLDRGKSLFDGRVLKVNLAEEAERLLAPVWRNGDSATISSALTNFYSMHWDDMQRAILERYTNNVSQWKQQVAEWIYAVDHISLEYGIKYKGVILDQLSSGTKGIVLLLLYLIIDVDDNRPLIIDQPEENLDPNSVFEELVGPFREICKRRQVIIVTHNPNLVVNTDVDQVIVANMETPDSHGLPLISYQSGSIENKTIRDLICKTLEGGEQAFIDREKRYRIKRIRCRNQLLT